MSNESRAAGGAVDSPYAALSDANGSDVGSDVRTARGSSAQDAAASAVSAISANASAAFIFAGFSGRKALISPSSSPCP